MFMHVNYKTETKQNNNKKKRLSHLEKTPVVKMAAFFFFLKRYRAVTYRSVVAPSEHRYKS